MAACSWVLMGAQVEASPRTQSSLGGQWAGGLTSCSKLAGEGVERKWVSTLTGPGQRLFQAIEISSPKPSAIPEKGPVVSSEWLLQKFSSDPSRWWEYRSEKKNIRAPDFQHKCTKKVLWMESWSNPPWVEAKLSARRQGRALSGDASTVDGSHGGSCQENNWMEGLDQAQLFVGHQTGVGGSIPTTTTTFERGPPKEFDKSNCEVVKALCTAGRLKEALHILDQQGTRADSSTYVCLLHKCIKMKTLAQGRQVHAHIIHSGFQANTFLFNTLLNMYAKCGSMVDAFGVFDQMPTRDIVTWTIMMTGYAKHGHAEKAFRIYEQMQQDGVAPDGVTFICILNACASLGDLEKGKRVHADISKTGVALHVILETSLVDMYAKCGSIKDARQVFDNMTERNVVSWNAMITGYGLCGSGMEAFEMYEEMRQEGVLPNRVTFICTLNACASLGALEKGKRVHADIIKAGIPSDIILETALVDMYAKCSCIRDARLVFDNMSKRNVFSWSAMIAGYAQHGCGMEALEIYEQMQRDGMMADRVTFICILNACANLGDLDKGQQIHAELIKTGIASDIILDTALVDMYAKCGSMKDALQLFDKMPERNVVSWNAVIGGYAQHRFGREALNIYNRMQMEGVRPDRVTFVCVVNACASEGALEKGKEVHARIVKAKIGSYINLENALVDMYAKCGSVKDARNVFHNMAKRDVVSWSAMIAGCAQHGCGREALHLFEEMQQEGLKPASITFISLLSACSHMGLVEEGRHYFDSMSRDHGLTPTVEHFCCMVDLFGRAGRLDEAENLINRMPVERDALVWGALLGACSVHGGVEIAERAAKCILNWDPKHPAAYVLLSDIYAAAGRWEDDAKVRKMMADAGLEPGHSCIEVESPVQTFIGSSLE